MTPGLDTERLAVLVHEVRSPVAALSAIAETLVEGELDADARRTLIRLVVVACQGIERIVADVSVASIRLEPVDPLRLVADVVAAARLRGAAVNVTTSTDVPTVWGDRSRLGQALDNLIANALVHASSDEPVAITVTADTMTRFLMTLEHAVDTVLEAVAHAAPGEIVIPQAPSAHVMDIARALIEDRPIEIRITSIRPGEKEHEILVSEEECRHTFRHGNYYVIAPMLPELRKAESPADKPLSREYSSADAPGDFAMTAALLRANNLMVGAADTRAAELLR